MPASSVLSHPLLLLPHKLLPKSGKDWKLALRRIWVIELKGRNAGPAHLTTGRDTQEQRGPEWNITALMTQNVVV